MDNMEELSLNEMEEVAGGMGGSPRRLPKREGFRLYRIVRGDTLGGIARAYNTTAEYLKSINPTIHNINDITAGYWIYVPRK